MRTTGESHVDCLYQRGAAFFLRFHVRFYYHFLTFVLLQFLLLRKRITRWGDWFLLSISQSCVYVRSGFPRFACLMSAERSAGAVYEKDICGTRRMIINTVVVVVVVV